MATRREQGTRSIHQGSTPPGRCIGNVTNLSKRRRSSRSTKTDVRAKLRNLTAETFNGGSASSATSPRTPVYR